MKDPNANRPGYKKTKVGCIPADWKCPQLRQKVRILSGGTPSKTDPAYWNGCIPWYSAKDLKQFRLGPSVLQVTEQGLAHGTREIAPGAVLVLVRGMMLNRDLPVGLATTRSAFNQDLKALVPKDGIDSSFLAYWLVARKKWFLRFVDRSSHGTGKLDTSVLRTAPLALPTHSEQQKIAEILAAWDESIEQTRELIDAKKRRKKGLMQQLLTGKKRLPGFDGEWETQKLGTLFKERRETGREDLPLLAITGGRGVIPANEIDRKDSSSSDKSRYKRIAVGDIGYNTMRMWQGVNALSSLEGIVSPAYTICIPSEQLFATFLSYYFKFQPVVHWFYRYSQGLVSDTWNLKFHHFAQISLPFPEKDEQEAIASVLKATDEEIACHEAVLKALEKQKRGLMQKLLTGTVRVKI